MEWLDQIILGLANIFVWVVTLGNNEPLYQALKDLVVLMATFFAGYKNTVMEMIAGIFVLRQKQYHPLQTQHENRPEWIRDDALNGPEWQKVKRYATLAMGMYYWPSYLFLSPRGPLTCLETFFKTFLFVPLRIFSYFSSKSQWVFGDGLLYKKTAAFLAGSNTSIGSLQYASWIDNVHQTPFTIVTDEETESIVVSIRGSKVNSWQFQWLGGGTDLHTEMSGVAMVTFAFVQRVVADLRRNPTYSKYRLVITGHSLGAGVASLLTRILKKSFKKVPENSEDFRKFDVRCYAFSPPGCMISEQWIPFTKECVYSFFVGNDLVPRLSYHSMKDLQAEVKKAIQFTSIFRTPLTIFQSDFDHIRTSFLNKFIPGVPDAVDNAMPRLYVPGHILHLTEDEKGNITRKFIDYHDLQELVVDGLTPFADHKPLRVKRIVEGRKHFIFSIPVLRNYRLVRQFVEYWY